MLKLVAGILVIGLILVWLRRSPAPAPARSLPFAVIPEVRLDAAEQTHAGGPDRTFELAYPAGADTARFAFGYTPKAPSKESPFVFSRGVLLSRPGSAPAALLHALAQAHGATADPPSVPRRERLDLAVAILGERLTRAPGNHLIAGEFTDDTPGPWVVVKLFVPSTSAEEEQGEIYLAINPSEGRAEFLVKDLEYWPLLATPLASIL